MVKGLVGASCTSGAIIVVRAKKSSRQCRCCRRLSVFWGPQNPEGTVRTIASRGGLKILQALSAL